MREGDAVRVTSTEGEIAAGALGVVVKTYPISDPYVVVVEFEDGRRRLPLTSIEEVTAVGATTAAVKKRGTRRG